MSWPPAGSSSSPSMRWTSPTSTPCRSSAACARCCPELAACPDYAAFYGLVERKIAQKADAICRKHRNLYIVPAPMMSLLMDGTIERAQDISLGSRWLTTTACTARALPRRPTRWRRCANFLASRSAVSTPRRCSRRWRTTPAAHPNYNACCGGRLPRWGQDDDYADSIACDLLASFARALEGRRNERGGIYRAGTGTAMYYVFHAAGLGATPDGCSAGEMIPANYSPSLFIDQRGPVSVIKSFTQTASGGCGQRRAADFEFDQSVFNNEESVRKLECSSRPTSPWAATSCSSIPSAAKSLLDAKVHPERHRNLIVHVWGWSGYFVELDECYQNHVINRIEFGL